MHRESERAVRHPQRIVDQTIRGVRLVRQTGVLERGVYSATVIASGRTYAAVKGNSKRFPWVVTLGGARVCACKDLHDVARAAAKDDAARRGES